MKSNQFKEITEWQKKTFTKASPLSKIAHLAEELQELVECLKLKEQPKETHLEFADCFILLFGAAASNGMSYEDICNSIDEKMQINYKRKWGKPKANGVVNHINQ